MQFKVTTSGVYYAPEQATKLGSLGFRFEPGTPEWYPEKNQRKIGYDPVLVEIDSLEALISFSSTWGQVIVSNDTIEIYDDYRE